jgi:hypothetical protein
MKKILVLSCLLLFGCTSHLDVKVPSDLKVPCVILYSDTLHCGWCKKFNPTWQETKRDTNYRIITYYEDVYDNLFGVQSIPTLIFIDKDGNITKRVGYMGKRNFKKNLKKLN